MIWEILCFLKPRTASRITVKGLRIAHSSQLIALDSLTLTIFLPLTESLFLSPFKSIYNRKNMIKIICCIIVTG